MPVHAAASGSAVGGLLEGFLSGAQTGVNFRRQRTFDQQDAEEIQRQRIAQEIAAGRRTVVEGQQDETLRRSQELEDLNLFLDRGIVRAPTGQPGAPQGGIQGRVNTLRQGVGADLLDPGSVVRPGEVRGIASPDAVGRAIAPEPIGGAEQVDPTDAMLERLGFRQVAEPAEPDVPFEVNVGGIKTTVDDASEAISLRRTLTLLAADKPVDPSDLRQEFARDPIVKDSSQIAQSFTRMLEVAGQESSGANDLAIIFSFMKLLDPGSVVREGEFANAQNSQGVPDRVRAMYNRAIAGERLTEGTRLEFVESARSLIRGQRQSLNRVLERYRGLAERSGVPVEDIVFDPFSDSAGGAPGDAGGGDLDAFIDELLDQGLSDEEIAGRIRARAN